MTNPTHELADAIRDVTAAVQQAIADGDRSQIIDADDLVEVLLAIADRLDPPLADPPVRDVVPSEFACPECGERASDRLELVNDVDDVLRCRSCGTSFEMTRGCAFCRNAARRSAGAFICPRCQTVWSSGNP